MGELAYSLGESLGALDIALGELLDAAYRMAGECPPPPDFHSREADA